MFVSWFVRFVAITFSSFCRLKFQIFFFETAFNGLLFEHILFGRYFDPCVSSGGVELLTKNNECAGTKSTIEWDDKGGVYVTESGYSYGEVWDIPRLIRIERDGGAAVIAEGRS